METAVNGEVINIPLIQMAIAYIFVLILIILVKKQKIGREKQILIAATRMTLQLIIVGYVLEIIFDMPHPVITLLIMTLMIGFALQNIFARVSTDLSRPLKKTAVLSIIVGSVATLFFFLLMVIRLSPWYYPRYFIPIAGMIIGNSMTGVSLGVENLVNRIEDDSHRIENALMMGASPAQATNELANQVFYNAVLPTINSMVGMGIIWLPGMMTGQILSGVDPLLAIRYQIAIMLGILGSVTLTVFLMIKLGIRTYFNERMQLQIEDQEK
ncbi:ABC transporter permease [Halarsenatibacter silvermanii]|uniref:Putative ABC transport system permease protein n=1 Tax=Halarsenatibacter silvermanii TaxID=321763 RepID=A0A1G9KXR3_9FIRM|nr:iron export ABC transporter permease subunit FetB [Halarsenatibacter silvermanii]SDL54293.1 putative ABC transport system permease protein [Halarsenatibacter silvermanii]